jgi:hypothetical protein
MNFKPDVVAVTSIQEAETGGFRVQGQPGYMVRPYLQKGKNIYIYKIFFVGG